MLYYSFTLFQMPANTLQALEMATLFPYFSAMSGVVALKPCWLVVRMTAILVTAPSLNQLQELFAIQHYVSLFSLTCLQMEGIIYVTTLPSIWLLFKSQARKKQRNGYSTNWIEQLNIWVSFFCNLISPVDHAWDHEQNKSASFFFTHTCMKLS